MSVDSSSSAPGTADTPRAIARDAYLYAFAMLENYQTMHKQAVDAKAPEYVGGFGLYRHYSQLMPDNKDIVTPNNDTTYSWAWLDLEGRTVGAQRACRAEGSLLRLPVVRPLHAHLCLCRRPRHWLRCRQLPARRTALAGSNAGGYHQGLQLRDRHHWHRSRARGSTAQTMWRT